MMTIEEERFGVQLGLLVEASGRVQTAVGRVMRWGLGAVDVSTCESNRDALLRDLDDMKASMNRVELALTSSVGSLPIAPVVQGHPGPVVKLTDDAVENDPRNGH
jgi:hypothetical protein